MKEKTTLLQLLESLKTDENIYMYDKVDILFKIAYDYDLNEMLENIVSDDEIDDILKSLIEKGSSWESIAIFLCDVRLLNQKYYYLNGYQNLENLSLRTFNIILDDFIYEVKCKGLENVIIEKEM